MRDWNKKVAYTTLALVGGGFLVLFLAWNGAASVDRVPGQFPYLISGGLTGLAMIGAGLTIVVVQSNRHDRHEILEKLDEIVVAVRDLSSAHGFGPTSVPEHGAVVAGRTSYHLPTCHLVEGREDLQVMSPESAFNRGLAPCRICEPQPAEAADEERSA